MASPYSFAKDFFAQWGIDTDAVIKVLSDVPVSLHCWQGDDVGGFENPDATLSGGIMATGNYPGKAKTVDQLRADADFAMSLIPGKHRFNLHAIYGEFPSKVERTDILPEHFQGWIDWAKDKGIGLDFNPTLFSHPMADTGFTLSSSDETIRQFWLDHCIACRKIAAEMGRQLLNPCVMNTWIPDGMKDIPYNRLIFRENLVKSLDAMLAADVDRQYCLDAVESKLFGIGAESYTSGSHEFYMGYAVKNQTLLCLDSGHFHPTETISDKISSVLLFVPEIMLHVSRGVRWDSDHVVILTDDLQAIAQELVRGQFLARTHIGLDFFDASINRIAAWTIGSQSMRKALLLAMLEPSAHLAKAELEYDYTSRLALMEAVKTSPWSAVWDQFCEVNNVPVGLKWLEEVKKYEAANKNR